MPRSNDGYVTKSKKLLCLGVGAFCICVLLLGAGALLNRLKYAGNLDVAEWERHIVREEILLDGFQGEYDILFLTDCHVVIQDDSDSPQVAELGAQRAREFQNDEGVDSARQFSAWIDYANEQKVDAVFLGGDVIDYPSEGCLDFLREQLQRLETPYLYTLGNHDWTYPWEYMTEECEEEYLPALAPYMDGDVAIHTWETEDLLAIAVDDSPGQVNPKAMERYEALLDTDKTVVVLTHVPFLTQSVLARAREEWDSGVVIGGGNYGGIYENEDSERFVRLTTAQDSPVALVLAGHVHFFDKDYIDGDKEILQIVGDDGYHGNATLLHIAGRG